MLLCIIIPHALAFYNPKEAILKRISFPSIQLKDKKNKSKGLKFATTDPYGNSITIVRSDKKGKNNTEITFIRTPEDAGVLHGNNNSVKTILNKVEGFNYVKHVIKGAYGTDAERSVFV